MCWMRPCCSAVPGGKESAEHAYKAWISDYKLESLPLPLTVENVVEFLRDLYNKG